MRAATLFSGIGAPEVAMPDWDWLWHAEIEKFPSAVMAARHPHSVNLGDVTADDFYERAISVGRPDVVVFGSPCQSYSVAGQRLGLDDPRGNLALVALGLLTRLAPRWFVFENVPGLLSSRSGEREAWDFGVFLGAVQDSGYQCAWASLDAQFFGLAQRRDRLFVVGHAQDWRCAAAVLLEPEGLCGHPPTRGQTGQGVANALTDRPDRGGGNSEGQRLITGTLESRATSGGFGTDFACLGGLQPAVAPPISLCLNAGAMGRIDAESETLIPIGGSFDAPELAPCLTGNYGKQPDNSDTSAGPMLIAHSLRADGFDASEDGTGRGTPLVAVCDPNQVTSKANRSRLTPELSHTLPAAENSPIAFRVNDYGDDTGTPNLSPTLRRQGVQGVQGVRRLMPVECERLQGFPDHYTVITYRGKPAADGPRYKAIGNSMAVPVIGWILSRIAFVDSLTATQVGAAFPVSQSADQDVRA